ncbi:MAG: cation acetate symporter [Anaerolineae bacterium]|nr:cation acetate symporter [Anaerolineae bacterium]
MIYEASPIAVGLFVAFVVLVLWISFYFARRTKDAKDYYAAGGKIHWAVNGVAFAGDYLSAASFLGIAGMIAFYGYDGFLYSIGFLAGWVVALFVVAEPLKRLGKYTLSDALDAAFNSKGIQLMAGISALVVSVCYLIPQMVGAGALVTPLLGLPHYAGVLIVGIIVILIVATAGMASTTYVQFLKGGLLIIFSTILTIALLNHGLSLSPNENFHEPLTLGATVADDGAVTEVDDARYEIVDQRQEGSVQLVLLQQDGVQTWWSVNTAGDNVQLQETLSRTDTADGVSLYNGAPQEEGRFFQVGTFGKLMMDGQEVENLDSVGPFQFLAAIQESDVVRFIPVKFDYVGDSVTVWYQVVTPGENLMRPGVRFKIDEGSTFLSKLDFVSLMLALFLGTAALPHILIRYYTVPSPRDARKSTIVAIAAIGVFYILTLFMGMGAMVNGVLDVESSNMSAPLLAQVFGIALFAIISSVAFATVLGTVSGLIVASCGAVVHDLMHHFMDIDLTEKAQVNAGKLVAIIVGGLAILLGILFKGNNVSFLVGLAFAVAASANLPSILMLLFWKKTTAKGITASILTGIVSSLGLILFSPMMWDIYGLGAANAPVPLENPGIISIPLSFVVLVIVSLMTQPRMETKPVEFRKQVA